MPKSFKSGIIEKNFSIFTALRLFTLNRHSTTALTLKLIQHSFCLKVIHQIFFVCLTANF